jgi:predicted RNA binding protein YcfA (HicA-like mRNA interferase family)
MPKRNKWDKCSRNSGKVIKTIRKTANEKNLNLQERQTGSHWIGKVPGKGSVVVPDHGEIPKGTWSSIMRMLTAIGIAMFILFSCYLTAVVLLGA